MITVNVELLSHCIRSKLKPLFKAFKFEKKQTQKIKLLEAATFTSHHAHTEHALEMIRITRLQVVRGNLHTHNYSNSHEGLYWQSRDPRLCNSTDLV